MKKDHIKNIEKHAHVHLGKADLHIHSNFSDGKPTVEEILDYVENKTNLDVIAITDHNTIDGALFAKQIMEKKKYRFELIVGEEISTRQGHLIGLFLKKSVPANNELHEAILEIKEQNGLAVVPHAFQITRMNNGKNVTMNGIGAANLLKERRLVDGVEVINATPTLGQENIKVALINSTLIMQAEIGDSDAHILDAIGKACTIFEGKTALDLRKAVKKNQTKALHEEWTMLALLKYLFFFVPIGLRMLWYTIIHGLVRPGKPVQISTEKPNNYQ